MNKIVIDGYIVAVSTAKFGEQITGQEYTEILAVIRSRPTAREGFDYRLKTDLTWEECKLPPVEPEPPTIEDKAEAYDILMGVSE